MHRAAFRHLLPAAALVVGGLLAVTGCDATLPRTPLSSVPTVARAPVPMTTTTRAATSTLTAAQLNGVLPAAPSGAQPWAAGGPVGILTPKQYVTTVYGASLLSTQLPLEELRGLRFVTRRNWITASGIMVDIYYDYFTRPSGAMSAYLEERTLERQDDSKAVDFTVPHTATSFGEAIPTLDSYGNAQTELHAVVGSVIIEVYVYAPASPDRSLTTVLAERSYTGVCRITDCTTDSQS
jgi:hypothetical protein